MVGLPHLQMELCNKITHQPLKVLVYVRKIIGRDERLLESYVFPGEVSA